MTLIMLPFVPGQPVRMPQACAACAGPATTTARVNCAPITTFGPGGQETNPVELIVPYCEEHGKANARRRDAHQMSLVIGTLVGVMVAYPLYRLWDRLLSGYFLAGATIAGPILVGMVAYGVVLSLFARSNPSLQAPGEVMGVQLGPASHEGPNPVRGAKWYLNLAVLSEPYVAFCRSAEGVLFVDRDLRFETPPGA